MVCRIFRELKLGIISGPSQTEEAISNIIFRDMGSISQQQSGHVFELHTPGETNMGDGISTKQNLGDENCSNRDAQLPGGGEFGMRG
jgi:hypothetical protein